MNGSSMASPLPLLEVEDLRVEYRSGHRLPPVVAVDGVSFTLDAGETVGLVGESGSGKTTIGKAILGLARVSAGKIVFDGRDITDVGYEERRRLSADLQVVFQDPYSSLNPARRIGQTLAESLRPHGKLARGEVGGRVSAMLERVGLLPAMAGRYPSQFSGGQRQRIALARALMVNPRLVVCDEPVSALDLSVQAQVLNLLRELQRDLGLSYLFISHNLSVVRHVSRRIVVLYRGRVMEAGEAAAVYERPAHPYTRALLEAAPLPDPELQRSRVLRSVVKTADSSLALPEASCPFAPRCPHAVETCWSQQPVLEVTPVGALVACHRWRELRQPREKRWADSSPANASAASGASGV